MSKKVCIYVPKEGENSFFGSQVVDELEKRLVEDVDVDFVGNVDLQKCSIVNNNVYFGDVNISECDIFFWYAKNMRVYADVLHAISSSVLTIKNPQILNLLNDKYRSHTKLKSLGFDVSEYALVRYDDFETMLDLLKRWDTVLIKPRAGSYGRGIVKVSDFETLRDIAGILELQTKKKYVLVEKFYPHTIEDWVSVVVVDYVAIYGYRKKEEKFSGWKVYDIKKEGGNAVEANVDDVRDIAERAARALEERIVCFDLIKTADGYKIIDENNFPGLYPEILEKKNTTIAEVFFNIIKKNIQL